MQKAIRYIIFFTLLLISTISRSDSVDSLLNLVHSANDDSIKISLFLELSDYFYPGDIENKNYIDSAFLSAQSSNNQYLIALTSFYKASNLNFYSEYDSAISLLNYAIPIFEQYNDTLHSATSWGEMGNSYCYQAIYDECLDCFLKSLNYILLLGNDHYKALAFNNIGNVYYFLDSIEDALVYFEQSYNTYTQEDSYFGIALSTNNIGSAFIMQGNMDSALYYLKISEEYATKINYLEQLAETSANLAKVYSQNDDKLLSEQYSLKSIQLNKQINSYYGLAKTYWYYGDLLINHKKYSEAKIYLDSAITVAKENNITEYERNAYRSLFKADSALANYHSALLSYLKYNELNDSLASLDTQKQIANLQSNFDLKLQEQENQLLAEKNDKQKAQLARQKLKSTFMTIGLFLFFFIIGLLFYNGRQTKKYNNNLREKNIEITQQKEEILTQNETLTEKNNEIEKQKDILLKYQNETSASINYALKIQMANLPNINNFKKITSDLMLIYLPRDIISGDFYFYSEISKNKYAIAVADCTGHGVPGALMSILNIALLKEVIKEDKNYTAAKIVGKVRDLLKKSLKQKWGTSSILDGMDISFLIYDKDNKSINYCGANRPLIYFRNGNIQTIKGNKQPVGAYVVEKDFSDNFLDVKEDDIFYLYSDGYIDQLSDNDRVKFMMPNFKQLLTKHHSLPLKEQKEILISKFDEHRKNERQTDDITLLALKF